MCQASVYLDQERIMEDVIWLEPTQDGILVRTFFEEPQEIKGVLQGIDLLKHRVLLTRQPPKTVSEGEGMSEIKEIEKLRVLLPHWQEHNQEHASEFRTWAERARALGETQLADHLAAAAQKIEGANHDLAHALEQAGGPSETLFHHHDHTH